MIFVATMDNIFRQKQMTKAFKIVKIDHNRISAKNLVLAYMNVINVTLGIY